MLDTIEKPSAELVVLQPADALATFTKDGAIDPLLQRIRDEIDAFVPPADLTVAANRDAIRTMARKVVTAKTMLEEHGKRLADEQKAIPKKIDACRKHIKDTLDKWRDEVRQPLTDWEAKNEARIQRHTEVIVFLTNLARPDPAISADVLRTLLFDAQAVEIGPSCEEFIAEYALAKDAAVKALEAAIVVRAKYEAEQAELAELRAKAAEREQRDREEALRREGEERAKKDAETKLAAERKHAEAAAQALREASERRERELVAAAEQATRDAAETEARLKREAEQRAETERQVTAAREADRTHRAKINRAALDALVAGGVTEDIAKQVLTLIASKKVPAVAITY